MAMSQTGESLRLSDMDPITHTHEQLYRQLSTRQSIHAVWAGFLAALDGLPADARVAFLMNDIFEASIEEVAIVLHKDPALCRSLVENARTHIQAAGPRQARNPRTLP